MKIRRFVFIHALLLIAAFQVAAQPISVTASLERDSMMIGDQLKLSIQVNAAEDMDFLMPSVRDTLAGVLEVLFPLGSDTLVENGRKIVSQGYTITGFETGTVRIPPQPVVFSLENSIDTALSLPLELRVYEPEVDTTAQIKPIKPPINTPLSFRELLPWLGAGIGGGLLIALAIVLVLRYRKRRKDPEAFSFKPQEPAHVIAFRELDRLKEQKLWEKGEVKSYYTRLTEITRHYIERQYGFPAMERTTSEILRAFRKVNPDDSMLDEMLEGLLMLSDLVKFAKEDPLPVDNQSNLNNAYLFIQKTYPMFYKEDPERKDEEVSHEGD